MYEQFAAILSEMFEDHKDIRWFGAKGVKPMANGNLAEIELSDAGYQKHYDKVCVRVVHPLNGIVADHVFPFSAMGKSDDGNGFYIWEHHGDVDWYGPKPLISAMDKLVVEVADYIAMWDIEA